MHSCVEKPSETSTIPITPEGSSSLIEVSSSKQKANTSKPGLLTAVHLLYELGMGLGSDDDRVRLGEYEARLTRNNSAVSNQDPPPGLGMTTDIFLTQLAAKLINTDDREAKKRIVQEHEEQLQLAGFGDHYGPLKIEELKKELDGIIGEPAEDAREAKDAGTVVKPNVPTKTRDYGKYKRSQARMERQDLLIVLTKSGRVETLVSGGGFNEQSFQLLCKAVQDIMTEMHEIQAWGAQIARDKTINWFCTDSSPPPEFDKFYARLYPDLPLCCKAYAFSVRLNDITSLGKRAKEPQDVIWRKRTALSETFNKFISYQRHRVLTEHKHIRRRRHPRLDWISSIMTTLFSSTDVICHDFDISHPLIRKACAVAERLKLVELRLYGADAGQALLLSKEFVDAVASYHRPLRCRVSGVLSAGPSRR